MRAAQPGAWRNGGQACGREGGSSDQQEGSRPLCSHTPTRTPTHTSSAAAHGAARPGGDGAVHARGLPQAGLDPGRLPQGEHGTHGLPCRQGGGRQLELSGRPPWRTPIPPPPLQDRRLDQRRLRELANILQPYMAAEARRAASLARAAHRGGTRVTIRVPSRGAMRGGWGWWASRHAARPPRCGLFRPPVPALHTRTHPPARPPTRPPPPCRCHRQRRRVGGRPRRQPR